MDYKTYTLMSILLASLALVVPIGTIYAQTEEGTTTNATDTAATTDEAQAPAINATGGGEWSPFDLTVEGQTHPIEYMITGGSVENMTLHTENQTLGVTINSMSNGTLARSEEHTSELQSRQYLVCRLLLEKKKTLLACADPRSTTSPHPPHHDLQPQIL